MLKYILAENDDEYNEAKILFKEYATEIKIDLSFQDFNEELNELHKIYGSRDGGIVLCKNNDTYIGCIAIRKISHSVGELKRMYVKPEFQNFGIGKILLQKAIELAENCKYELIRLDTLNYMKSAMHLYKQNGFYEIDPYYFNPITTAVFYEKDLRKNKIIPSS